MKLLPDKSMFAILDRALFERNLMNSTRGYFTYVQNATPRELKYGIYKPRLTLTNRFNCTGRNEETLSIEFSAPKMLFNNNFDELIDTDFLPLVKTLNATLKKMGVYILEDTLINAPVSTIHFSKNIPLTDYTTPHTYIKQLEKVHFNSILETSKAEYFNGGSGIKAHANSYEIAFYDKIKELQNAKISTKRTTHEIDSQIQLGLFDRVSKKKPFEVLRMEIRLGKRYKIKQVLKALNKPIEPTFKNLFSQELSQQILLSYLTQIEDNYPPLLYYEYTSAKKFFTDFLISNPDKKLTSALKYLGLRILLKKMGAREFRQLIEQYSSRTWYSLNRDMKNLKQTHDVSVFQLLRDNIANYEPLKLVDFDL